MIKQWLEEQAKRWLTDRGYWVIKASAPCLVISYGDAIFYKHEDGSCEYIVNMPEGHKLWALYNTVITPMTPPPKPRK